MTRACLLTPPGRGAIAVVRVWGPGALAAADAAFRPRSGPGLAATTPGRPRVGRVGAGTGDEVVALVVAGEPPEVEVHCHGGPAAVALVLEALAASGAIGATVDDWARHRAGGDTPSVRAALALAAAPTARCAEILLEQAAGALEAEVRRIAGRIASDAPAALADLDALIARGAVGTRLVGGWRVALAGRPNVGKSRLLNALAGYERAIVAPVPGTTRDVVTARLAFDGWPVELSDTAGLRPSDDPLEAAGIALARARQAEADLVVLLLDRSEPLHDPDRALISAFPGALWVATKSDLPAAWPEAEVDALRVSADRGDGLDALIAAIARRLVPDPPPPGAGVPIDPGQLALLHHARERLMGGDPEVMTTALVPLLGPEAGAR